MIWIEAFWAQFEQFGLHLYKLINIKQFVPQVKVGGF